MFIYYGARLQVNIFVTQNVTGSTVVKKHLPMQEIKETWVRSLSQEDSLDEQMAQYSCLENPMGRGATMKLQRVGHN